MREWLSHVKHSALSLCFVLCVSFTGQVLANIEAINWLQSQSLPDGSYALASDISDATQSTSEAVQALIKSQSSVSPQSFTYLSESPYQGCEYIARKIKSGIAEGVQVNELVNQLISLQNSDGGFGELAGYESTVLDTALALDALAHADFTDPNVIAYATGYLQSRQQANGGFPLKSPNSSSVYTTSLVSIALQNFMPLYDLANEVSAANSFILSQQTPGGVWQTEWETALALSALIPVAESGENYQTVKNALLETQLANGSWGNDVYVTSLALGALQTQQTVAPSLPELATVMGVIIDASTGASLANVTVNVIQNNVVVGSASTAANGSYTITNMPLGVITVSAALPGYHTVSGDNQLFAGDIYRFSPNLIVQPQPVPINISGQVIDAELLTPITGAVVVVLNSSISVNTNSSGDFSVTNISPGSVTLQIIRSGYITQTYSISAAAGGDIDIGTIGLNATSTASTNSRVSGVVIDSITNAPLNGAAVTMFGVDDQTAFTDINGQFVFENVTPGSVNISASAFGYQTSTVSFDIVEGEPVNILSKLVAENNIALTTIKGEVLDAGTQQPLADVSILIDTQTETVLTGVDGSFQVAGLQPGTHNLSIVATGYRSFTYTFTAGNDDLIDLGKVSLLLEDGTSTSPGQPSAGSDLSISQLSVTNISTNLQTHDVAGSAEITVINTGIADVTEAISITLFEDLNNNGDFDNAFDHVLGDAVISSGLTSQSEITVGVSVNGSIQFRDSPILAKVDSNLQITESNEINNIETSASACRIAGDSSQPLVLQEKWHWDGSQSGITNHSAHVAGPAVVAQLSDDNSDGVIDSLDTPDVVFTSFGSRYEPGVLRAVRGDTGAELWSTGVHEHALGSATIGDIDNDGLVEILTLTYDSSQIIAHEHNGVFKWAVPTGFNRTQWREWGSLSLADLNSDGQVEIIYGARVFDNTGAPIWTGSQDQGGATWGVLSTVADVDNDGDMEVIAGRTLYDSNGVVIWHKSEIPITGHNAVGNFDDDEFAEIVIVSGGFIYLYEHDGVRIWGPIAIPGAIAGGIPGRAPSGGPPTVGDFDGDGQPEIGVSTKDSYSVFETDGTLKWDVTIYDGSAETSSSSFDFESDGKVEILYADEEYLRIFDGETGAVRLSMPNRSLTAFEYPVVVDIDNDSQAEIILASNWSSSNGTSGIRVYESANNDWAPTRSIWNQHSYHINNVNDDGTIPQFEEPSWLTHNTYRLNTFPDRDAGALADLTLSQLEVIDNATNNTATIRVLIGNAGLSDLTEVTGVSFYEGDPDQGGQLLGVQTLNSLPAGTSQVIELENINTLSGLRDLVAVVDINNQLNECNETNNQMVVPVYSGSVSASLQVSTSQPTYEFGSQIDIEAGVTNLSAIPGQFKTVLQVEDRNAVVIEVFNEYLSGLLQGQDAVSLSELWNSSAYRIGRYQVRGKVYDLNDVLLDESVYEFSIIETGLNAGPGGEHALSSSLFADKSTYKPWDDILLEGRVRNISNNTISDASIAELSVTDPLGNILFTESFNVRGLMAGAYETIQLPFNVGDAASGTYIATLNIFDQVSGALLNSSSDNFDIELIEWASISANINANLPRILPGESIQCSVDIMNNATTAISGMNYSVQLLDLSTNQAIEEDPGLLNLNGNTTYSQTFAPSTAALVEGSYLCVLTIGTGNDQRAIAAAGFTVTTIPAGDIQLSAQVISEGKGRLLVLLDDPSVTNDMEPNGPAMTPMLSYQRSYLEGYLDQGEWSYTIVTTMTDFMREFHQGGYTDYALFNENDDFDVDFERELREAVYRGAGLLMAGGRNDNFWNLRHTVDILYVGTEHHNSLLTFTSLGLQMTGQQSLPFYELMSCNHVYGSSIAATFLHSTLGTLCKEHNGAAVVTNSFGQGRAVFTSFDLLVQASGTQSTELLDDLILNSLDYVHPDSIETLPGKMVPVRYQLSNLSTPTGARVLVNVPANVPVVDMGNGSITNNVVSHSFNLSADETQSYTLWLQLPESLSPLTVSLQTQTGSEPNWTDYDVQTLVITPQQVDALDEAILAVNAIATPDWKMKQVLFYLERAKTAVLEGNYPKAISHQLNAIDYLLKSTSGDIHMIRLMIDNALRETGMMLH